LEKETIMLHRRSLLLAAAVSLSFVTLGGQAATMKSKKMDFHAYLTGMSQVPPVHVQGLGTMTGSLEPKTKMFTYVITYMNLTGPAVAAHFHGPAMAGANAGVALPIKAPLDSPIMQSVKLTDPQIADLTAGKWYVNIHTAAHKSGEIRGQVMSGPLSN
jgi:hypothetical protein